MAKKHMKKCSPSLLIKEIQIKTLRFHVTAVRIATTNTTNYNKRWLECGEKGTSDTTCVNVN
jgi:hypothetical protein